MNQGVTDTMNEEKRSSTQQMTREEQLTLLLPKGVGGRQKEPNNPSRGGGYPNICTDSKRPVGRRASREKIVAAGVNGPLLDVAELVGPDLFLEVWRLLDQKNAEAPRGQREANLLYIPCFSRWTKIERDELILDLAERGETPKLIEKRLKKLDCEPIGATHIAHILRNHRLNSNE